MRRRGKKKKKRKEKGKERKENSARCTAGKEKLARNDDTKRDSRRRFPWDDCRRRWYVPRTEDGEKCREMKWKEDVKVVSIVAEAACVGTEIRIAVISSDKADAAKLGRSDGCGEGTCATGAFQPLSYLDLILSAYLPQRARWTKYRVPLRRTWE